MTMYEAEKWVLYEEIKAIFQELGLTPEQYEEAIYKLAEVLGI